MSFFSNAKEISDGYETYVEEFHELFRKYGVSYGRPQDFLQLSRKLRHKEQFCVDFSTLTRSMERREAGSLTLTRMLTIIAMATGGPEVTSLQSASAVPLAVFLEGLGGWSETEAATGTTIKSTSVWTPNSSETATAFRADRGHVDIEQEAREHGWLIDESANGPGTPPASTSNGSSRTSQSQPQLNMWALKVPLKSVDRRTDGTDLRFFAPKIKKAESPVPVSSPVNLAGFAAAAPKAANANVSKTAEKDKPRLANGVAELVEIAGAVATARVPRQRFILAMLAVMLCVPPIVLGVLLYRDYARTARGEPAAAPETHSVEMDGARGTGPPGRGGGANRGRSRGQSRVGNRVEDAVSGQDGREHEVGPVSGPAVPKDTTQSQSGLNPTQEIPVLKTAPGAIPRAKQETPPTIIGTESVMPEEIPEPVTAVRMGAPVSVAPPVNMARNEGGPNLGRGLSGVRPLEPMRPTVAVSAGLLSSYLVNSPVPSYPKVARRQKLEGDVLVRVLISDRGKIERAVALNGPPTLRGAVEKAMRRWRYKPYVLDGKPVEVQTWVTFHFRIGQS